MAILEEVTRRPLRAPLAPSKLTEQGHHGAEAGRARQYAGKSVDGAAGGKGRKKNPNTNSYEGLPAKVRHDANDTAGHLAAAAGVSRHKAAQSGDIATRALRRRRRIPKGIRQEVIEFGKRLRAGFGADFAAARMLKHDVARLLASRLPPDPRRPGRPGYAIVTAAIRLRAKLRRSHPEKSHKEIWHEVYRQTIPRHGDLPLIERRAEEDRLRKQVRWRLVARRRCRRPRRGGKPKV